MKKIVNSLIISFIVFFGMITSVFAAGTATMSLSGSDTVTKGSNVTYTISISNVTGSVDGKVAGIGCFLHFDPEYLEYRSAAVVNDNWSKTIKTTTLSEGKLGKIAVNYSDGETTLTGGILKVVFNAKKSGSTTLSFSSAEASDKGANLLTVTTQSKTITINDPAPVLDSDSKLKSLGVTGYTLSPTFNSNTKAYTVDVPEGTENVTITAQCNSSKATVDPNTIGQKSLTGDSSTFTVKCTAENGTSTNYTVTVNREKHTEPEPEPTKSSDSKLKSLGMSGYDYSPKFDPDTLTYSMTVSNGIRGLYVQAEPNDPKATVDIEGDSKWDVGKNTVKITVTAEDGSKTVYKVNVTRESEKVKSNDKNVDFKIYSPHTIEPQFSNDKNDYEVTVPYDVTKLDLSVIPYDSKTKVEITGNDKFSTENENEVKIKVTAEDGSSKTIILKVKRSEYKANTDLLDLKVKDYEMSPVFKASTTNYKVTVPHKVRKVTVLVKAPEGATYKITGNRNLQVGNNVVLVKVTDKKGFTKYYQIDVTRKKGFNFFGLGLIPFLIILFLLLILLLLLLLLLRRRKRKKEKRTAALIAKESSDDDTVKQEAPVHIDFKPEFNFNSKNGTDDDVVYSNGPMLNGVDEKKLLDNQETVVDAKYDIYDDVVTKDELVDALNEGIRTKNVDKLQMLLDQENLNRKKNRMKRKEESEINDYKPEHVDNSDDYDDFDIE